MREPVSPLAASGAGSVTIASSDPDIAKSRGFDPRRIEHVSAVEEQIAAHDSLQPVEVDRRVLGPGRAERDRVGACRGLVEIVSEHDTGQARRRIGERRWIVSPHRGATLDQHLHDLDGWRIAQVVGAFLERQTPDGDLPAVEST